MKKGIVVVIIKGELLLNLTQKTVYSISGQSNSLAQKGAQHHTH